MINNGKSGVQAFEHDRQSSRTLKTEYSLDTEDEHNSINRVKYYNYLFLCQKIEVRILTALSRSCQIIDMVYKKSSIY
jgi:hypothetical protein